MNNRSRYLPVTQHLLLSGDSAVVGDSVGSCLPSADGRLLEMAGEDCDGGRPMKSVESSSNHCELSKDRADAQACESIEQWETCACNLPTQRLRRKERQMTTNAAMASSTGFDNR